MKSSNPVAAWNSLMGIAIVVLLGACILHFFVSTPKPRFGLSQRLKQENQIRGETEKLKSKTALDEALIAKYVWPGDSKLAEAEAMAEVTKLAKSHDISLGAFRPQRSTEDSGLRRLPFSLNVEGPYLDLLKFLQDLETPSSRLAVHMLQVSATDAGGSHVAATISVLAFQAVQEKTTKPNAKAVPKTAKVEPGPITDVKAAPAGVKARPAEAAPKEGKVERAGKTLNKGAEKTSEQH